MTNQVKNIHVARTRLSKDMVPGIFDIRCSREDKGTLIDIVLSDSDQEAMEIYNGAGKAVRDEFDSLIAGVYKMRSDFNALASDVADYLKLSAQEDGYESVREMWEANWFGYNDIRADICEAVRECGGDHWDDEKTILFEKRDMPYKRFRVLVMRRLKEKE